MSVAFVQNFILYSLDILSMNHKKMQLYHWLPAGGSVNLFQQLLDFPISMPSSGESAAW